MDTYKIQVNKSEIEGVVFGLKNIVEYLETVNALCGLDIESVFHGYAITDGVVGMLKFPVSVIKDATEKLTQISEGSG